MTTRRQALAALSLMLVRPVSATPDDMAAAVARFTQGTGHQLGKVSLEIAQLVDNGNAVPVTIRVDSRMSAADHVTSIALFNEKNPSTEVALFTLGPRAGKAEVSTRIRLATSQRLIALARMNDGSYWSHTVDVIVTLAACIEGEAP